MLSSMLLRILNENANGALYPTSSGKKKRVISTAYVNNVNTHHNTQPKKKINMIKFMMVYYNQWKELLEARGDKLAVEKCTYYAVDWDFSRVGKPSMKECATATKQVGIDNTSVRRIIIMESNKLLGHLISPKESTKSQDESKQHNYEENAKYSVVYFNKTA